MFVISLFLFAQNDVVSQGISKAIELETGVVIYVNTERRKNIDAMFKHYVLIVVRTLNNDNTPRILIVNAGKYDKPDSTIFVRPLAAAPQCPT